MKQFKPCAHRACAMMACAAVIAIVVPTAQAEIVIQFAGLNLAYDGSAFFDAGSAAGGLANPADADPLTYVDFFADGSLVGSLNSDISVDVFIPDVVNIPAAPGTFFHQTTPGNPGFFDLLVGTSPLASEFLLLDLEDVDVTYLDVSGLAQFTFGAAIAPVAAQNLPFDLEIGTPVLVSFSAQVDPATITAEGGFITGFEASGTGELSGELIPEPATALLLVAGALAMPRWRRRRSSR